MPQEKLQHLQECIGRTEAIKLLKLVFEEGPNFLSFLNEKFRNDQLQEVKLQLANSMGGIYLYGSLELVKLCKEIVNGNSFLECSESESRAFQKTLNIELKKSFSAIDRFLHSPTKPIQEP